MFLIGNPVNGGIYGELFPQTELGIGDIEPEYTFAQPNADIKGLTSMHQVYGPICEWLSTGSSETVIPSWQNSMLEQGVDLSNILS